MEKKYISVLIADDQQVSIEGLRSILDTTNDIRVVGEAESAQSVSRLVSELSPDVLLMDLNWFDDQTIGWIKIHEIKEKYPEIKIIAITAYPSLIPDARKAGADDALTKHFHREDLINLIYDVVVRKTSNWNEKYFEIPNVEILTPRETEVLYLLEKGLSDKEISDLLNIEISTSKNHVKSILQKLDVENRRKAVIRAKELNLLK